ncbi:MAG: Rpn family recombination-promoting nuclease/putative transposase [Lachnospiraceae bacterium]|nr:Rpn family recombination-promoting nuclease/putative transposase [Lachnospiraceae bacterium]
MERKKFKDLNLSNAFLFAAALTDEETCSIVLELVLGKKFPQISVKTEHAIFFSSDFRSVRFDVYAKDETEVSYDLEMQTKDQGNLPKRARFYQAEMDVTSLKPGEDFNDLKPSYVIFICTFDPFGDGLYQYTFEEVCRENNRALGDETVKIFLNTKGKNDSEVPCALVELLKYIESSTDDCAREASDPNVQKLHEKVMLLKKSRELEENYMHLTDWLEEERREGRAEGRVEGHAEGCAETQQNFLKLISLMTQDGMLDDIPRLSQDLQFLEEMFQKYNL